MYITKDELYDWQPINEKQYADYQIPDELGTKLQDAMTHYKNACQLINAAIRDGRAIPVVIVGE